MTITDVLDRWADLIEARPYSFVAAPEPFSFEVAPAQALDHVYCLASELTEIQGQFDYTQAELHRVTLHLAEKVQRAPEATWRALAVACNSLTSTVLRDREPTGSYTADVVTWEVQAPGQDEDYLIARLVAQVDLERAV